MLSTSRNLKECKKFRNIQHAPVEELHSITSPWSFAMYGMDILGPFLVAKGQTKFLFVAIDYFTKWVEEKPLTIITTQKVQKFIRKSII